MTPSSCVDFTSNRNVNVLLCLIRSQLQELLGEKLVGLYLSGSLVVDDFDSRVSDIDLVAALTSDVSDGELKALRNMHEAVVRSHADWHDRIEVCYVPVDALQHIKSETRMIVNLSPGEPLHRTRLRKA